MQKTMTLPSALQNAFFTPTPDPRPHQRSLIVLSFALLLLLSPVLGHTSLLEKITVEDTNASSAATTVSQAFSLPPIDSGH